MSRDDLKFMDSVSQSATLVEAHYSIGLPLQNKELCMSKKHIIAEQCTLSLKKKAFQEIHIS